MLKNIAIFAALCGGAAAHAAEVAVASDGDVGAHMSAAMAEYAKVQQVQAAVDAGTFVPSAALTASLAAAKQRLAGLDSLMSSMLPAAQNAAIESKAKYAALRSVNADKRAFEEIGLAQLVPHGDALAPLADKMGKLLADWRTIQRVQHDMDAGRIHADEQLRAALHAAHARFDMLDFAMRRASAKWGNSATAQTFMRALGHEHEHEHEHGHLAGGHHSAAARRHASGAHHSNPHARGDASTDAAMEFDVKAWVAMNTPLGLAPSDSTPAPALNPVHFSWLSLNAHPEEIDAHLDRLHAQADALGSVYRYGNYVFAETEAEAEAEEDAEAEVETETEEDAEAEVEEDAEAEVETEEDAEAETEEDAEADAEESEDAERVTVSQTSVAVAELHSVPLTADEKLAALQAESAAAIEARGTAAIRGADRLASRA